MYVFTKLERMDIYVVNHNTGLTKVHGYLQHR